MSVRKLQLALGLYYIYNGAGRQINNVIPSLSATDLFVRNTSAFFPQISLYRISELKAWLLFPFKLKRTEHLRRNISCWRRSIAQVQCECVSDVCLMLISRTGINVYLVNTYSLDFSDEWHTLLSAIFGWQENPRLFKHSVTYKASAVNVIGDNHSFVTQN